MEDGCRAAGLVVCWWWSCIGVGRVVRLSSCSGSRCVAAVTVLWWLSRGGCGLLVVVVVISW